MSVDDCQFRDSSLVKEIDFTMDSDKPKPIKKKRRTGDKFASERKLMALVFGRKDELITRLKDNATDDKAGSSRPREREPVWHDSDDEDIKIEEGMQKSKRQRYLQDPQRQYKQHLDTNFDKVIGQPKWASINCSSIEGQDDDDDDKRVLKKVGHIIDSTGPSLLPNRLDYHRRPNLNNCTRNEGAIIVSVEFHPRSCVAMVAGSAGVVSLFSVESSGCDKLHSVCFRDFPIKCAKLSNNGNEALLGSPRNLMHSIDLITGQSHKIRLPKEHMTKAAHFELSPDGELMAIAGRFGEVHIMNAHSKEWICTMKQEHDISGMAFSNDSQTLYCHSNDNEVTIFDLRKERPIHRFIDDGCIIGKTISFSPNGRLLVTGSGEGIVNIYNANEVATQKYPQPIKMFSHLTTGITATKFNPTSEILAFCSVDMKDSVKLAHFPSATVFANFPITTRSPGNVRLVSFSPGGRYLALGTINNRIPLYELRHYNYF